MKLDLEVSQPAVVTVTHCRCGLPLHIHTHTLTHTHTQARACTNTHTRPQNAYMHTYLQTSRHTHSHERAHTHEPRSMGSRVILAPCFIKGAVTIGLLLLCQLLGYNRTECAGLMLLHFSPFFTWCQGRKTETGQHVIRGQPWRWVGSLQHYTCV